MSAIRMSRTTSLPLELVHQRLLEGLCTTCSLGIRELTRKDSVLPERPDGFLMDLEGWRLVTRRPRQITEEYAEWFLKEYGILPGNHAEYRLTRRGALVKKTLAQETSGSIN